MSIVKSSFTVMGEWGGMNMDTFAEGMPFMVQGHL